MNPGVPGSLVGVVQTSCGADHECRHILDLVAPVNPVATVLLAEGLPESARGRQVGRWATAHQQQVLAMSQNDAPRHGWRWRSLRRLGFDRNPKRRGTDRIQAIIRVGLLVVFLAGAPAAAVYAGHVIYLSGMRAERAEAAAWHRVPAVILRVTPTATGWSRSAASALLSVQWVRTDGSWGTGKITGAKTALAGGTTTVWVDAKGRRAHLPLTRTEVITQVIRAAVAIPVALALLLAAIYGVISLLLDKHRLACWETDWSATEPQWTRSMPPDNGQ